MCRKTLVIFKLCMLSALNLRYFLTLSLGLFNTCSKCYHVKILCADPRGRGQGTVNLLKTPSCRMSALGRITRPF